MVSLHPAASTVDVKKKEKKKNHTATYCRPALDSTSRMLLARDGVDTLDPLLLLLLLLPTSRLPKPTNMVALSMRSLKLI